MLSKHSAGQLPLQSMYRYQTQGEVPVQAQKKKKNLAWLPSLSNPKSIIPPTSLGRQVLRLKQEPEASYPTAEIRSRTLYFEAKWNLFGRDPFCQLAMICEGMNRPLFSIFFFCPELQTGICRAVVNFKCVSFGTQ